MKIELVRWIEPCGEYEQWNDPGDAEIEPLQWGSVGVLVDENPVAITLATQVDLTTGSWMQLVTIPRKAIISRQRMSSGWTLSGGRASKSTKRA